MSGFASLMIVRTLLSVLPRQSPSSLILLSISSEAPVLALAIWIPQAVETQVQVGLMPVVGEAWQILQTPFRILRPGPVTRTRPYLRALVLHSAGENLTARGPLEDVVGGAAADSMGGVARRGEYSRLAARRVIA